MGIYCKILRLYPFLKINYKLNKFLFNKFWKYKLIYNLDKQKLIITKGIVWFYEIIIESKKYYNYVKLKIQNNSMQIF